MEKAARKNRGLRFADRKIRRAIDCQPALSLIAIALFIFLSQAIVFAQPPDDDEPAPPPVRVMSKGERNQLESKPEVKEHTKLALELMNVRLARAEALNTKGEHAEMYNELGGFHALMDDTLDFLYDNGRTRDAVLNNFKRFEIGLRTFAPRLGLIRRELPLKYDPYVKNLLKYIRDARNKAIEPLFGDSVVPTKRTT